MTLTLPFTISDYECELTIKMIRCAHICESEELDLEFNSFTECKFDVLTVDYYDKQSKRHTVDGGDTHCALDIFLHKLSQDDTEIALLDPVDVMTAFTDTVVEFFENQ